MNEKNEKNLTKIKRGARRPLSRRQFYHKNNHLSTLFCKKNKKRPAGRGIPASPHKERNDKWYNNYVIKIFDKFVHLLERQFVKSFCLPLVDLVSAIPLHIPFDYIIIISLGGLFVKPLCDFFDYSVAMEK